MKFTFKTTKATGPYQSFHSDEHVIKLRGIEVGYISDNRPYKIHLQVTKKNPETSDNPHCKWMWVVLVSPKFETIKEAKQWLKTRTDAVIGYFESIGEPVYIEGE